MKVVSAREQLTALLAEIEAGPFTVSRVCAAVKPRPMDPSIISRWRASKIEPRLSSIDKLAKAHRELIAKRNKALAGTPAVLPTERELADL